MAVHYFSHEKASPKRSLPNAIWNGAHQCLCTLSDVASEERAPGGPVSTREGVSYPQNSGNIKPSMMDPLNLPSYPSFLT